MRKQEYLGLMASLHQNKALISALMKANEDIMNKLRENYPTYLATILSESDDWWFMIGYGNSDMRYYHVGKCISVKEGLNRGEFEAEFEYLEGFTTNYGFIAKNGNSPILESMNHYNELLYNSKSPDTIRIGDSIMQNEVEFIYDSVQINEKVYREALAKLFQKLKKYSQTSYNGISCGDNITYIKKYHGIQHGTISLITGKTAYCTDGEKVSLRNGSVEKENERI